MVIRVKNGVRMYKHIKKALRIPYMQFYIDKGTNLLIHVTKAELKRRLTSPILINGIYEIKTDHKNNKTIIYWRL